MSDFQNKIKSKYKNYTLKKENENYNKLCGKTEIKLNKVQQFLGKYVQKENRILLFHGIGSGKTITMIHMCESADLHGRMFIVTQASLIGSFYDEIIKYDVMTNNYKYIEKHEYNFLQEYENIKQEGKINRDIKKRYKSYMDQIRKRIIKKYRIMSYERFCSVNRYDISDEQLLIIDEVQNIVGLNNTRYHQTIRDILKSEQFGYGKCGIILSSGTPIYDNYKDFFLTLNLLTPDKPFDYKILSNQDVPMKEKKKFLNDLLVFINHHVSYYEPSKSKSIVYPKREIMTVECPMSDYQFKQYDKTGINLKLTESVESLPVNFFLGPRLVSNFAFPKIRDKSKGIKVGDIKLENLHKFSSKYHTLLSFILKPKNKKEKIIIYSSFVNEYGIKLIKRILEVNGFKDYKNIYKNGEKIDKDVEDYKTFACFSGKETDKYRNEIKNFYNNEKNNDGKNLRIILLSPAGKEGLSLFGVRQIHIMEPYWNMSRIEQILGRGYRRCSHRFLPPKDRDLKVYIYLATIKERKEKKEDKKIKKMDYIKKVMSVDKYIFDLAQKKDIMNKEFNDLLRKNSIDCELFKDANGIKRCQKLELNIESMERGHINKI